MQYNARNIGRAVAIAIACAAPVVMAAAQAMVIRDRVAIVHPAWPPWAVAAMAIGSDMGPCLAPDNKADAGQVDAEQCRNVAESKAAPAINLPHGNYVGLGQLGLPAPRPAGDTLGMSPRAMTVAASYAVGTATGRVIVSTREAFGVGFGSVSIPGRVASFDVPISRVVCVVARPEMSIIATRRIITIVQHAKAVGKIASAKRPRDTMSAYGATAYGELAISPAVQPGHPRPTRIRPAAPIHLGPKAVDVSLSHRQNGAIASGDSTIEGKHRRLLPVGRWGWQARDRQSILQSNYSMGVA